MKNYFKLEDVADVKLSNVDKKVKTGEKEIRLCNYTDVYKNTYIDKNRAVNFMIASCNEKEFEKFLLKKGQVSITKDSEKANDIGVSTYIEEDFQDVVLGYHLALITPYKEKLDGKYLNYWFNTSQAKRYFENNVGGSGQRFTLPLDVILSTPLFLPNIENQKKISSILFSLDKKIQLLHQINDNLAELAKTIYDYWFVQFDFPDENGKPYKSSGGKMVYNNVLKREIPEGWEVDNIFNVASIQYGFPFSTEFFNENKIGVPVIRIRDIKDNQISNFSTEEKIDSKYIIKKGEILIGMDGNFHINYWANDNCYLNQRVVKIQGIELSNIYLKEQIEPYIKTREKSISRTTVGHLSDKDLRSINIIIPNNLIMIKINSFYNNTLNKFIENLQQIQHLQSLRDWLLPMLMNGQVSVE